MGVLAWRQPAPPSAPLLLALGSCTSSSLHSLYKCALFKHQTTSVCLLFSFFFFFFLVFEELHSLVNPCFTPANQLLHAVALSHVPEIQTLTRALATVKCSTTCVSHMCRNPEQPAENQVVSRDG